MSMMGWIEKVYETREVQEVEVALGDGWGPMPAVNGFEVLISLTAGSRMLEVRGRGVHPPLAFDE
jgi:hypothetical protein